MKVNCEHSRRREIERGQMWERAKWNAVHIIIGKEDTNFIQLLTAQVMTFIIVTGWSSNLLLFYHSNSNTRWTCSHCLLLLFLLLVCSTQAMSTQGHPLFNSSSSTVVLLAFFLSVVSNTSHFFSLASSSTSASSSPSFWYFCNHHGLSRLDTRKIMHRNCKWTVRRMAMFSLFLVMYST